MASDVDVVLTLLYESEDHVVFLLGFDGDEVHAVFPADVPAVQPVDLPAAQFWDMVAEEVVMASEEELFGSWKRNDRSVEKKFESDL